MALKEQRQKSSSSWFAICLPILFLYSVCKFSSSSSSISLSSGGKRNLSMSSNLSTKPCDFNLARNTHGARTMRQKCCCVRKIDRCLFTGARFRQISPNCRLDGRVPQSADTWLWLQQIYLQIRRVTSAFLKTARNVGFRWFFFSGSKLF